MTVAARGRGAGAELDDARVGLVAMIAVLIAKAVASGRYLDYVRHRMFLPLTATALLLLAVSIGAFISVGTRTASGGEERWMIGSDPEAGERRDTLPHLGPVRRAGSLLVLPVVLMGVVPAAPLGAFAAGRQPIGWRSPPALFPPLPAAAAGAVPMGLSDFVSRALYDPARSLRGVRVRLIGFVAFDPSTSGTVTSGPGESGSFLLVRFAMYCCAADALAIRVRVMGATGARPPPDTWLEVTGTWRPASVLPPGPYDPDAIPAIDVLALRVIPAPEDPYDGSV